MGAEITWDGRVLPCCFDKDAQYEMGKLPEMDFHEIWRSPAYKNFRGKPRAITQIDRYLYQLLRRHRDLGLRIGNSPNFSIFASSITRRSCAKLFLRSGCF
jgi:hypothetical protein